MFLTVGNDGFEDNDSGDFDKENVNSKSSLNNPNNQPHLRIKLDGDYVGQVKGIDEFRTTSEPVTPVTMNGYPPSRMTYVDAVRKGTNISK